MGTYTEVFNTYSITYEDPKISLTDPPKFEVETDNVTGRRLNRYGSGKKILVYRDGQVVFNGVIEPHSFEKSSSGSTMKIGGISEGYKLLQDRVCDYYRASNNSYAPVVNPWQFGRLTNSTSNALVDGLRPDEIMKCVLGTKCIWQEWFDNHDYLLTTTIQPLVVYDGFLKLPKTSSVTAGTDTYALKGTIESVSLMNGDQNVDPMGTILSVSVKLVGTRYGSYNPYVYVCRDDGLAKTWHAVSLTFDGSKVWTGSYSFTDNPGQKNQLGYVVSMNSDGNGTTLIDYARFDMVTESDTGVEEGSIAVYDDPNTTDDTVAINLAGQTRLEALEKLRLLTNTSTTYSDVNWDAYIDNNCLFHFMQVRGVDRTDTFSFDNKNLTVLKQDYDGEIKNSLVALGQGEEPYAVTIVGSVLQDASSIATYGQKTGYFIDKSIPDAPTLYKRAKAYLKYMATPRESLEVSICNDPGLQWRVGDRINIVDSELDISGVYRVLSRKVVSKQDSVDQVTVELGTKSNTLGGLLRNIQSRFESQEIVTQGSSSPAHALAAGLVFDSSKAAEYDFYVPENAQRVMISCRTAKFRAYSKANISESLHTHAINAHTTDTAYLNMTYLGYYNRTFSCGGWANTTTYICTIPNYNGSLGIYVELNVQAGLQYSMIYVNLWVGTTGSAYYFITRMTKKANQNAQTGFDIWSGYVMINPGYAGYQVIASIFNESTSSISVNGSVYFWEGGAHDHYIGASTTGIGSSHTHGVTFGIYEYDYFPAKVSMRIGAVINPISQLFGYIGRTDQAVEVTNLDITDELRDPTTGKLTPGMKALFFSSQNVSPNTSGLGIISVSHQITVKTAEAVDLNPLPVAL
jgi:hypothetical protein